MSASLENAQPAHSHAHAETLPPAEIFDYKHVGGKFILLGLVGGLALLASFIWGFFQPRQFAYSYLLGFYFFFTICLGGFFWTLVHHGVDAEWSVTVRRQMENLGSLLIFVGILFIPFIFVKDSLWIWMTLDPADHPLLAYKLPYLTEEFFWARSVFYFGGFALATYLLRRFSIKQDADGDPKYTVWNRKLTFACLPFFAVALTFAAFDHLMGLNYEWFSTMWGVYIFAGSALSSICVLVLIITAIRSAGYLKDVVTVEHYHIMGKLMFAFTVFWAYIGFSQYMLIWYANIPEETIWFMRRNTGSWWYLSQFLVVGHFFIPFLLLLPQPLKRKPAYLCGMAVWILLMHFLDVYVMILPELHQTGVSIHVLDILCPLGIGCILAAAFLKLLGDSSLFPAKDPRLALSIKLKN